MTRNRKPTFFTSDWHCFHANSIVFDNRPFKDLDEMHSTLIKRYNATVPENGICYFLGDMGFCGTQLLKSVVDKLNGTKVLILGNHDKKSNAMFDCGFDAVLNGATLKIANELVTLTHCPLRGLYREDTSGMLRVEEGENWHGENRHPDFSIDDTGQFHLHGHIHSNPSSTKSTKISGRQFDVGVPANNYTPVSISVIESWIVKTKGNK